ncbi:MAG: acetyl-CoA C-acyltransferase, partial [Bryobacterales bacterium]|nr:acetyl-CoA C-acyltransferase [Bryobacterales bacterium]
MQEAVIIDCLRTAVGKSGRGTLRNTRPDEMGAAVVRALLEKYPQVPKDEIDDVIIGCAMPEGESGMNMARVIALRAGLPDAVPGV